MFEGKYNDPDVSTYILHGITQVQLKPSFLVFRTSISNILFAIAYPGFAAYGSPTNWKYMDVYIKLQRFI